MEQHPVPQNIATFQFKLFGNLTVRQFVTLLIPLTIAALIFFSNALPPIIRVVVAGLVGIFGFVIAVVPFNGRPFDKWVVSFIKAIVSPTERIWIKEKKLPEFLTVVTTPAPAVQNQSTQDDTQSRERLIAYLKSLPSEKQSPLDLKEQVAVENLNLDTTAPQVGKLPPTFIWQEETQPQIAVAPRITKVKETGREPKFISKIPKTPSFRPKTTSFKQKAADLKSVPQKPSNLQNKIIKIASYAKPFVLPGLEQKLAQTKFSQVQTEPLTHLASQTNYVIQNVIPIQTSENQIRLIPSIGQIRVRKLHFAPPPDFDLSKLPVRGEKKFDVSEELKKRFENSEESLLNAFSEQVPKPIIQAQINTKVPKTQNEEAKNPLFQNLQFIPKAKTKYTKKPQVAEKIEQVVQPQTKVSFIGKKVQGQAAQTTQTPMITLATKPNILSGIVANPQSQPIEAAVIVVRDQNGIPVRALKTNKLGQFLSVTPLSSGTYTIETEAPNCHFSPRSVTLKGKIEKPIEIIGES